MASDGVLEPGSLAGAWRFTREVDDRREGRRILVTGTATFVTTAPDRIAWHEEGVMQLADGPVPIAAHRLLTRGPGGDGRGRWAVDFADGSPFHPWQVGTEVLHDCSPDTYRGLVTTATAGEWTMVWAATGPAKDFTITTRYTR